MKVHVRSAANRDVIAIAKYYEGERLGLGRDFHLEVEAIFRLFCHQPHLGQGTDGHAGLRGFQLKRFPYQVIYRLTNDAVTILAVVYQGRRPASWRDRVQERPAAYPIAA